MLENIEISLACSQNDIEPIHGIVIIENEQETMLHLRGIGSLDDGNVILLAADHHARWKLKAPQDVAECHGRFTLTFSLTQETGHRKLSSFQQNIYLRSFDFPKLRQALENKSK